MAIELYKDDKHMCIKFHDILSEGEEQTNQILIIHENSALLMDPGGYKKYSPLIYKTKSYLTEQTIDYILLSHQDPDVGAGLNGWLLATNAKILISILWERFIPNFCSKDLLEDRLITIPDEGRKLDMAGEELLIIPAHFLHSAGNFQLYDPHSKILFSGDLGASMNGKEENIDTSEKFKDHIKFMENFHKRYIPTGLVCKKWVEMIKNLGMEMIVPQHGARFTGKETIEAFLEWLGELKCGVDLLGDIYKIPG